MLSIPFEDWRTTEALQLQAKHYLRKDGKMEPVCFVCGAFGHQCGECLLHLQFLGKKGKLDSIPAVGGTEYQYGQPVTEVCSLQLCVGTEPSTDAAHNCLEICSEDTLTNAETPAAGYKAAGDSVPDHPERMRALFQTARENLELSAERMKDEDRG